MRSITMGLSCLLALASVFSAEAQTAVDNGYRGGAQGGGVGLAAVGFDQWYEMTWGVEGCCDGYSGCDNSIMDPGTTPWTLTVPAGQTRILEVCDGFQSGDSFTVYDNETPIGDTSVVGQGANIDCNLDASMASPAMSHASFTLTAGQHSITICPSNSPFGGGAAFFRISAPPSNGGGEETTTPPATGADFLVKKTLVTLSKPLCGRKFIVWVQVENIGSAKGDAGYLSLTVDGRYFGAVKVGSLEAKGVREITKQSFKTYKKIVKFTNVKIAKEYSPTVLNLNVDCYNATQEQNENNNTATKNVSCK